MNRQCNGQCSCTTSVPVGRGSGLAIPVPVAGSMGGSAAVRSVAIASVSAVASFALSAGPRLGEEVADEPARTQLVELVRRPTEEPFRTLVQRRVIEVEFGGESDDEFALTVGALPHGIGVRVVAVDLLSVAVAMGLTVGMDGARGLVTVVVAGNEPGLLDLAIHGILEQVVEAGCLVVNLGEVGQFGFAGDAELVGAVAGEAQPFGVIGDKFDCHDRRFGFVVGFAKTAELRKSPISQRDRASKIGPQLVGSISGNADSCFVVAPSVRASPVTLVSTLGFPVEIPRADDPRASSSECGDVSLHGRAPRRPVAR